MADEKFSPSSTNRRAFARTVIRQPATLLVGNASVVVQTLDIGPGGLSLLAQRPIGPGTRCSIAFALPFGDAAVGVTAGIKIVYSSYVAVEQFKLGAVFIELDPAATEALERFTGAGS